MISSQDYKDNMFGMSMVNQFLKKKKKGEEAKETVTCSRDDSGHTCSDERNETRRGGSIDEGKGAVAGGGVGGGKPNEVLSPKQAEKWGKKIGEVKKNAAPMNKLTKNQMKAQSAMGPPAPKK